MIANSNEVVVLVPGLYSSRLLMLPMAYRLRRQGYKTVSLPNRYLTKTPAENAAHIFSRIQQVDATTIHLLGHSLGGIVIMHVLEQNSQANAQQQIPEGRVVLMGAPILGSSLARKLHARSWFRPFLGKSVQRGLLGDAPQAVNEREIGLVTGSQRRGLLAPFFRPSGINDGVVTAAETALSGASDAVCIPQSHTIMLFSRESVDKVASFFKHGQFV